jgi:DNA-3-methyladenine glycosylase II
MSKKIIEHFKKHDPIMYKLTKMLGLFELVPSDTYFYNLTRSITSQQLSTKSATAIFKRFVELFQDQMPTAEAVLKVKDEKLRSIGYSRTKIVYIKDLAQKVLTKEVELENISKLKDEEIIEHLTKVKGIGVWTVEMFLIFSLAREDIFSHGDLGLKNAIKKLYNLENPTREEIEKIISKWSPYKTYASRLLWQSLALKG